MNCTKFTPPLQIFVDFYFYYSFLTLFLTLFITPLQFYIIFTKSKSLNNFKWIILNQSFWCFAVGIIFATVKPFFTLPAVAGFPIGLFRHGNRLTTILGIVGLCFVLLMLVSAFALTLANRYLFVFPSKFETFMNKKLIFFCFCFFLVVSSAYFLYTLYPYISIENLEERKSAEEFDTCLKMFFKEPSFVFFSFTENAANFAFIVFLFACFCFCAIIFFLCYFIYRVFFHKAASIVKLQMSLITSVIVQVFISLIFLCLPIFGYVSIIVFQISHVFVSNLCQLGCCAISTHSFLESVATLYFVAPYRKAVIKYLGYCIPYFKKEIPKPVRILHTSIACKSLTPDRLQ